MINPKDRKRGWDLRSLVNRGTLSFGIISLSANLMQNWGFIAGFLI